MARSQVIRRRTISLAVQSILLAIGMIGLLAFFMFIHARIPDAFGVKKLGLIKVAWIVSVLAWLAGILFVWSLMRYYRFVDTKPPTEKKRVYVDAWAEAGRRFQLEDEDESDSDDDQS